MQRNSGIFGLVTGLVLLVSLAQAAIAEGATERAATSAEAAAAVVAHGENLFKTRCASCHDPAVDRAPPKVALTRHFPDDLAATLKTGIMQPMAAGLSDADINSIAAYLSSDGMTEQASDPAACATAAKFSMSGPGWNGWSIDARNSRLQPQPGLARGDLPRLQVKWSMTYIGGRYGQPTLVGGRLFLTSSSGRIYSLDAKTGCMYWRFDADAGVRTTPVIGRVAGASPSGYLMFFGDFQRNEYALDAASGSLQWKIKLETHARGTLTGAPALYKGMLYVPISSWEETAGGIGSYECCTARGALAALDAKDGRLVWKTYTIEQPPQPTVKNSAGTQMYGPAGAAVWSAPTIDAKRGAVYIGTGDSYTDVKENGSDVNHRLGSCHRKGQVEQPGYRKRQLPDGLLSTGDAQLPDGERTGSRFRRVADTVHAAQWQGHHSGRPEIRRGIWDGSGAGENTMAQQGGRRQCDWAASNGAWLRMRSDCTSPWPICSRRRRRANRGCSPWIPPRARQLWYTAAPKIPCGFSGRCFNAQSAAPSVIPGVVLSTTTDGHLRAYSVDAGKILWDFDTAGQKYQTINGVKDQVGGTLDVAGPTVAGGMMYIIAGYAGAMAGPPNNVLLAFSVDGK